MIFMRVSNSKGGPSGPQGPSEMGERSTLVVQSNTATEKIHVIHHVSDERRGTPSFFHHHIRKWQKTQHFSLSKLIISVSHSDAILLYCLKPVI